MSAPLQPADSRSPFRCACAFAGCIAMCAQPNDDTLLSVGYAAYRITSPVTTGTFIVMSMRLDVIDTDSALSAVLASEVGEHLGLPRIGGRSSGETAVECPVLVGPNRLLLGVRRG